MITLTKIVVFTCFCSVIAYMDPNDYGDKLTKLGNEWHDICTDVTGATEEMIEQVRKGNFINDIRMKMDRNLNVKMDELRKLLPPQALEHHYSKETGQCLIDAKNSGLKENYEKVYVLEECVHKLDPQNFIMF